MKLLIVVAVTIFVNFLVCYAGAQVLPEYGTTKAVIYSFGSLPTQVFYLPKENLNQLIEERFKLYQTAVSANPSAKHIFLLNSLFQEDFKNLYSSYFEQKLNSFKTSNPDVQILKRRIELDQRADEWARDFVPVSVRDQDHTTKLFNTDYRAPKMGPVIASTLGMMIVGDSSKLPGGNIMSDNQGNCYMTDYETTSPITKYCRKVVVLPFLDLESTLHLDLFAKLINNKTAIVSNYTTEDVEIIENPFYLDAVCSDAEIASGNLYSCGYTMTADGKPYKIISENGETKTIKYGDVISYVTQKYQGINITNSLLDGVNWTKHSEAVAKILQANGLEVVKIEAPKPMLRVQITRYKDIRGNVLKQEAAIDFVFRSYTNSLVTNDMAVVPTYPLTRANDLDISAINIYKKFLGTKVYAAPSDYSILGGGAVHCLTHEIPN